MHELSIPVRTAIAIVGILLFFDTSVAADRRTATYCNPLDLPYRFQLAAPSRREAADPTMVVFKGEYWLFASKSGGYWHSRDLQHWEYVQPSGYPVENYAPTVAEIDGRLYLTADDVSELYTTDNPAAGQWQTAAKLDRAYRDPALFVDDDGRVYLYDGLSKDEMLRVAELDRNNGFKALRTVTIDISRAPQQRGWEVPGDTNARIGGDSWIEGSWMTKHAGRYYLQYAAPGTEYKTYADGLLTSDKPMGPFSYAPFSPFSFKPTGFITGAGHSSTFRGLDGNWWHVSTQTISVRHIFERRLALFPTRFESDGQLVVDTYLGDYPRYIDGDRGLVGWMLLSHGKPVTASSELAGFAAPKAVDEDIRTWWSAQTANAGEWLQVDLGGTRRIEAVQINFADEGATALGRSTEGYRYTLAISDDGKRWKTAIDRVRDGRDAPHDYQVLPATMRGRYVRLTNVAMPGGARFSVSGLRVFGNASFARPAQAKGLTATRDPADPRHATLKWQQAKDAHFYIVRMGTRPDRLFQSYQVYGSTELEVRHLTVGVSYYATVDTVNEAGITPGADTARLQ